MGLDSERLDPVSDSENSQFFLSKIDLGRGLGENVERRSVAR